MKRSNKKTSTSTTGSISKKALSQLEVVNLTKTTTLSLKNLNEVIKDFQVLDKPVIEGIDIGKANSPLNEDVLDGIIEPTYGAKDQQDIQGNIIPGFNKDHQQFLFYSIKNKKGAKKFLKWVTPYLASMEEVVEFRKRYRIRRLQLGKGKTFLCSTWVNIAFSHPGIVKLTSKKMANSLGDESFRQGLAARSTFLGDPSQKRKRGHTSKWVIGGDKNEADIIVIVASDGPFMLEDMTKAINDKALSNGLQLMFKQKGDTLPGDLRGHEHFGFRDGISQPGVRGRLSARPGDYITPRYISNTDDRRFYYSKPGQQLVWPGQFLLGEPRQSTEQLENDEPPASRTPKWARRGSYLVVRRLHQDVRAFWEFVTEAARRIGISPIKAASMMVGRWPSGAPVLRSPGADNPALAVDEFANNHFIFDDDTRASDLRTIPGYGGDRWPQATADFLATVCPHFAHIKKMNMRDSVTDLGKPEDNASHMILRRGIPYGPPIMGVNRPSESLIKKDRGLMFLSYGSTIEHQFEFLQRRWANSAVQPNSGGHDPIIGQNGSRSSRIRFIDFPKPNGGTVRIRFKKEWVVPTGGGYFFAPSISTVKNVLGA